MNVEKIILQDLLVAIEEFHIEGFDLWADLNEDGAITIQSTGHVKIKSWPNNKVFSPLLSVRIDDTHIIMERIQYGWPRTGIGELRVPLSDPSYKLKMCGKCD